MWNCRTVAGTLDTSGWISLGCLFVCVDPATLTCYALQMGFSVFQYSVGIFDSWQPESNGLKFTLRDPISGC